MAASNWAAFFIADSFRSNYNWTKQSFVYFGVSLGDDPDKTKA
jgi:hypothetical protein